MGRNIVCNVPEVGLVVKASIGKVENPCVLNLLRGKQATPLCETMGA
jgi:hypothetical protein